MIRERQPRRPLEPEAESHDPLAPCRVDVHVHSRYSDRPSEWFLRRLGAPECYVEPLHLYRTAKQRGMRFVTISDHNCINGALDIAHLPDTFISNEVTTYFPEDGCKIHLLTFGINEAQFATINDLRENIYELRDYLLQQNITHSVAHPLFRVNDRLAIGHVERLMLLFNHFEAINGTRDRRACELSHAILRSLTPAMIERMANDHNLEPIGPTPWQKHFTGGSDDHSGVYLGTAATSTPPAADVEQFLDHIREGRSEPAGEHGTSLLLAHCFYHIGYGYYKDRLLRSEGGSHLVSELFAKLLDAPVASPASSGITGRMKGFATRLLRAHKLRRLSPTERVIVEEFAELYRIDQQRGGEAETPGPAPSALSDRRTFDIACRISHILSYSFVSNFQDQARKGRFIESLQTVASLGPVALAIAPYLAAFRTQHKDEAFLQSVASHFPATRDREHRSDRKAWITDTYNDVNGVARTIHRLAGEARQASLPLSVLTCQADEPGEDGVVNFKPLGTLPVPEYEQQEVAFPPFLEVIEHIERARYSELIISTPGPMGLVALAAAKLLGLKTKGIYHTDFPAYVRHYTEDVALERLTWRYMLWFYEQMDTILVPSNYYRRQLIQHGFTPSKLVVMRRGVDLDTFSPSRRDAKTWSQLGLSGETTKFLYVGRLSREKNLDLLVDAFAELRGLGKAVDLVIVGDGPYAADLRRRAEQKVPGRGVVFTGELRGDALARIYASADVFVFPSTTDTLGNVVLEAQASGLPVITSDRGGPAELVRQAGCGWVVDVGRPGMLATAMDEAAADADRRAAMAERAIKYAGENSWASVLKTLWHTSAPPSAGRRSPRGDLDVNGSTGEPTFEPLVLQSR